MDLQSCQLRVITPSFTLTDVFRKLLTTAVLTLTHLLVTTYIHFTRTLNPSTHVISTAVLTAFWLVSLAMVTWNLSWTLGHRCIKARWHDTTGIAICRMYKALTAFAVCGALTTIISLFLDVQVGRRSKARGVYNQMGDVKPPIVRLVNPDGEGTPDLRTHGEGWERRSHDGAAPYKVQKPIEAKHFQYEQPSEQNSYAGGSNYF